jgi:hypothetical protein
MEEEKVLLDAQLPVVTLRRLLLYDYFLSESRKLLLWIRDILVRIRIRTSY